MASKSVMETLASQLETNYIPTDDEMHTIREMLLLPKLRLAGLKSDIAHHEAAIKQLSAQHDDLARQINNYYALISPARRLPADILREIFLHCLPTEHYSTMSGRQAPILLTHICSAWRDIALTTPALWASIHIPVPASVLPPLYTGNEKAYFDLATTTIKRRLNAVRQWILRSGAMPLCISLNDGTPTGTVTPNAYIHAFLNIVIQHAERWKKVTFNISTEHLAHVAKIPADKVPLLQTLDITLISCTTHPTPLPNFRWQDSTIVQAPTLRSVTFVHPVHTLNDFAFQWAQLTHLSIVGICTQTTMSLSDIVAILHKCTQLVVARLTVPPPLIRDQEVATTITMPYLRTLRLHDIGGCVPSLWIKLHLPVLEVFGYHTSNTNNSGTRLGSMILFFRHTGGHLRRLSIYSATFDVTIFIAVLHFCPNLKSLFTSPSSYVNDALLARMNRDGDYLIPNLEVLEFKLSSAVSETAVLNFINARQGGGVPGLSKLKRVAAQFNRPKDMSIANEWNDHVATGLKLALTYDEGPFRGPFSPLEGLPASQASYIA